MLNRMLNIYNDHTTKIIFATGAILGLLVGLLFAWVIWPTSYRNATPEMLRQDFRDDYLAWVASEYASNNDLEQARGRLSGELWKKEDVGTALEDLAQRRGGEDATNLQSLAQALAAAPAEEVPPTEEVPSGEEGEQPSFFQNAKPIFQVCGAGLIAAALGGLIYLLIFRMRSRPIAGTDRAIASQQVLEAIAWDETADPLCQFKTTYSLGDDFYDPSFSVEKATGDFMGECGVGISETIGVGDPKKVTALEVWLFDKNDIRTVTKVLMSEHALQDESLRTRLASKGDPILAQPGAELILDTATLILRARVTDVEYGVGQLPPESFFQRITMELGIWVKPEAEFAASPDLSAPSPASSF